MPLIEEIETALLEVAELPHDQQKDIAVMISRMVMVFDDTLTKTVHEQGAQRDEELKAFRQHFASDQPEGDRASDRNRRRQR